MTHVRIFKYRYAYFFHSPPYSDLRQEQPGPRLASANGTSSGLMQLCHKACCASAKPNLSGGQVCVGFLPPGAGQSLLEQVDSLLASRGEVEWRWGRGIAGEGEQGGEQMKHGMEAGKLEEVFAILGICQKSAIFAC